ncbi:transposase, partial [Marinithermofilum abyssi]
MKSLRELEWRLRYDSHARTWIGLSEVPDHSTLSRRVATIEKSSYELLFH